MIILNKNNPIIIAIVPQFDISFKGVVKNFKK